MIVQCYTYKVGTRLKKNYKVDELRLGIIKRERMRLVEKDFIKDLKELDVDL